MDIVDFAFLPSKTEVEMYKSKLNCFINSINQNIADNKSVDYYTFYTRTPVEYMSNFVYCANALNKNIGYINTNAKDAKLLYFFYLIYKPDGDIAKSCKNYTKTVQMPSKNSKDYISVTNTVPVVEIDGAKFIWLNKDRCENENCKTMLCCNLDISQNAVAFDEYGNKNEYSQAVFLRKQCNSKVLSLANSNPEFATLLVPAYLYKSAGYDFSRPIKKVIDLKNEIIKLFENFYVKKFTAEQLRQELKILANSYFALPDSCDVDADIFLNQVQDSTKWLHNLQNKKDPNLVKIFNDAISKIENINL